MCFEEVCPIQNRLSSYAKPLANFLSIDRSSGFGGPGGGCGCPGVVLEQVEAVAKLLLIPVREKPPQGPPKPPPRKIEMGTIRNELTVCKTKRTKGQQTKNKDTKVP